MVVNMGCVDGTIHVRTDRILYDGLEIGRSTERAEYCS